MGSGADESQPDLSSDAESNIKDYVFHYVTGLVK